MKAAQINHFGHSDAVAIEEIDRPFPKNSEVLIEVRASSINPVDTGVREGRLQQFFPIKLPATLGADVSGVVVGIGPDVEHLKVGDHVYGQASPMMGASGAFAEYAVAPERTLALMPNNLTFAEAASVALTGLSAYQALYDHLRLQNGQRILIHGGAGGIGTTAIQIAKHIGAYVATTATGEGISYVRELGADEAIDYATQTFEERLRNFDAVFDTVGGDTYRKSFQVLRMGGRILSMLMQPDPDLEDKYNVTALFEHTNVTTDALNRLTKLIEEDVVTVHIERTFKLSEIRQAFDAKEHGQVRGKIAVVMM
jgi:alcohol dehydrogenase